LPTGAKKHASFPDAKLIAIAAVLLTIGALLIKVFHTSLPPQYHSPSTSCSKDETLHPDVRPSVPQRQYFWAQQKGNSNKSGAVPFSTPDCLSHEPTWKWVDPVGTPLRATPIIDDEKNIYLSATDGRILKFNQHGSILWNYTSPMGALPVVPALLKGMMIESTVLGLVFALDMETGKELWNTRVANATSGDTAGILVVDDVIVLSTASVGYSGNSQVVALSHDGLIKWRYTLKHGFAIYNFQAASPGDGTVVFMDSSGGVYRLSLASGESIWESGIAERNIAVSGFNIDFSFRFSWFSTGAAVIGPNGVVYCSSNTGSTGIFHAYRLEDGRPLWRTNVEQSANTGLAVGYLAGSSELAVVAGVGANPGLVTLFKAVVISICVLPVAVCACSCLLCCRWRKEARQGSPTNCEGSSLMRKAWRLFVWMLMVLFLIAFFGEFSVGAHNLSVNWKDSPNWLFLTKPHTQRVVALNAADGSPRWSYELPAFRRAAAAGDEERLFARFRTGDPFCFPDNFNQGVINGFGSVFIGHADGRLYTFRDSNSDGRIDPDSEVSYYDFGDAFQAGVGLAPGLVAVVPCGGGLYVWRS